MESKARNSLLGVVAATILGVLVSATASDASVLTGSVPVFAICGAIASPAGVDGLGRGWQFRDDLGQRNEDAG